MDIPDLKFIATIILFLLMILSGMMMTRKGKPYNVFLFNVHKLLSLGALVLIVLTVISYSNEFRLTTTYLLLMILSAGIFIILLITGGLLNAKKETPSILLYTHRISPILLTILMIFMYYIMLKA